MKVINWFLSFFKSDEIKRLSKEIIKETIDAIKKRKQYQVGGWTKEEKRKMKGEILEAVNPLIDLLIEKSSEKQ